MFCKVGVVLLVVLAVVGIVGALRSIFGSERNGPWNTPEA